MGDQLGAGGALGARGIRDLAWGAALPAGPAGAEPQRSGSRHHRVGFGTPERLRRYGWGLRAWPVLRV